MRYFDDTNTGELMARVKDEVDKIQNALGYVGMLLIEDDDPCGICFILHVFPELENGISAGYSHALLRCGGNYHGA